MRFILASSSPRRLELLQLIGIEPLVVVPEADESMKAGERPEDFIRRVTIAKGESVKRDDFFQDVVISADTLVLGLGKVNSTTRDNRDTVEILKLLSGTRHEVWTGLAIFYQGKTYYNRAVSYVYFSAIADREIDFYLDNEAFMDKAGAYGIQGKASVYVERIEGCYFNIMGFPLNLFYTMLKTIGLELAGNFPGFFS